MKQHFIFAAAAAFLVSCDKPAATLSNKTVKTDTTSVRSGTRTERQLKNSAIIIYPPGTTSLAGGIPVPPPPPGNKHETNP